MMRSCGSDAEGSRLTLSALVEISLWQGLAAIQRADDQWEALEGARLYAAQAAIVTCSAANYLFFPGR